MQRPAAAFVLAAVAVLTLPLAAQTVRRFDMGTTTSAVAPGFTAVTPGSAYSAVAGFGWTAGAPVAVDNGTVPAEVPSVLPPALLVDSIESYGDLTFRVDLPNGRWHLVVYLGNVGTLLLPTPRENLDVLVNGAPAITDTTARTLTMKAQTLNALGGYRRIPIGTTVTTGSLALTFQCDGTGNSRNAILGIECYPNVAAPILFDHATRGLVADAAHAATLAPALAAFNTADYDGARAAFAAVADARLRAWGYAWLLGWLTGDEEDLDLPLLGEAKALLQGLGAPDDISVAGLLHDLQALELGVFYNRARGYTPQALPGSFGSILTNLSAAVLLFDQFRGDTLGPAEPRQPESPLFCKARYLQARNMYGRNTHINDPNNPFTAFWLQGLLDVWNNIDLFPKAADATVMGWVVATYGAPGSIQANWTGPQSLPPITPGTAWWAPFVAATPHPNAPAWANAQRRYHNAFRNCGEWWMTRRLLGGEIGGGDGDDVEGAGLLGLPSVVASEPGHVLESGVAEVMDQVLFGPSMTPSEGYFTGCGDVEHSAEFSTNPLFLLLAGSYGHPKYVEYALRTLRNLDELHDPVPWTLPDGIGGRHFRAYNLGANVFCGASRDIPINLRAAVPGFALGDYAGHPRIVQVFDELARAWASHALSTQQGKPAGVFPAAVNPAPPYVFGTNGQWWANAGYIDLAGGPVYHNYLYALLLSAYAHSTAPDRHVFLQPFVQAGLFLHGYLTGTVTGTAPGSGGWTANLLKGVIADRVAQARALLLGDPAIALSAADLAKIDAAIAAYASAFEKHVALPVTGTKSKAAFETVFGNAAVWTEYLWPLCTSSVSYTDRIYVMTGGSQGVLFGSMTGASTWGIVPPSVLSWINPDAAAGELDFAALVNDLQPTGLDVLLFHFGQAPRDFGLQLWRNLPAGQYEARLGADANHDDTMDGPPHTVVPFTLANPGYTVTRPAGPTGVLQKVEIRQTAPLGAPPALLPDPALSLDDVRAQPGGGFRVTVHNLGSAPVTGAAVELVQNGAVLATAPLATIPAPLDYAAKTTTATLCCAVPNGLPVTVRVVLPPGTAQVTPVNDAVTWLPPTWIAYGAGCPGPNGVPSLTVTSLPQLGSTFTLQAQNLSGGLAVMATGLAAIQVPLSPFGLGFGAGCDLLVTLDLLDVLPQTAGSAQWSLALPLDPSWLGLHLYNQVAEFGPGSSLSNGGEGVVQ